MAAVRRPLPVRGAGRHLGRARSMPPRSPPARIRCAKPWSRWRRSGPISASSRSCGPIRSTMLRSGLHWMVSLLAAGLLARPPRSLFDTTPAARTAGAGDPVRAHPGQIAVGPPARAGRGHDQLHHGPGRRILRRRGRHRRLAPRAPRGPAAAAIDLDVLMASSAIPFIFPACEHRRRPLRRRRDAPAGAAEPGRAPRRQPRAGRSAPAAARPRRRPTGARTQAPPSPGHLLGFVLDSLFTDGLSIDLERLQPDQPPDPGAGAHRAPADPRHGDPAERRPDR